MEFKAEHISKTYDSHRILTDVTFTVGPGECLAVTGASGIGKTTLLRILLGLEEPDTGRVLADGEPAGRMKAGAVFQENRLVETADAVENVRMATRGISRDKAVQELKMLLPEDALSIPAVKLSGGMQRRVAVVRAVLSDARILIMDEPLSGLDDGTKTIVTDYIRSRQQDRPWILTVHEFRDLPFAKEYRLI